MAQRTSNSNKQQAQAAPTNQHAAGFTLTGKLDSVFVGKKFAYAKIHVSTGGQYYDLYNVAFPLDTDFPDDGATVSVCGTMHTFKGNAQFTGTVITGL